MKPICHIMQWLVILGVPLVASVIDSLKKGKENDNENINKKGYWLNGEWQDAD